MIPFFLCITDGWLTAISTAALAILTLIIAIYAKGTFEESIKSFKGSINEINVDRIIGIIHKQFDIIEKAIDKFEIIGKDGNTHCGYAGFFYLDKNLARYYSINYENEQDEKVKFNARKQVNENNLRLLIPNNDHLYILSNRIYNAVNVVKQTLLHSRLNIAEINQLKKLLYDNLGFINIKVLREIKDNYEEYNKLFGEDEDYVVDYGSLNMSWLFLKSVVKFEDVSFTAANFESLKKELLQ